MRRAVASKSDICTAAARAVASGPPKRSSRRFGQRGNCGDGGAGEGGGAFGHNAADPETPVVALYLLAQIGLFTAFRRGVPRVGFLAGIADTLMVRVVTRAAMWAVATGLFFLANADG